MKVTFSARMCQHLGQKLSTSTYNLAHIISLCENCEDMSRSCDASVRLLSYPYVQTGFKYEQDLLLLIQWGSLYIKSIAS